MKSILVLIAILWSRPAVTAEQPQEPPTKLIDLVKGLGSESWSIREQSQELLLKAGTAAISFLEEATHSDNLELAYRARSVLERIDPFTTECQLIKVELGRPPRIVAVATATGPQGRDLTTSSSPTELDTFRFDVNFQISPTGQADVRVAQKTSGLGQVHLGRPLASPNAVSWIKTSEECRYERKGLQIDRVRRRYLTLFQLRHGRLSALGQRFTTSTPEVTLLTEKLLEQARGKDQEARAQALSILAELRPDGANDLFKEALEDPESRAVASLGLEDREMLSETARTETAAPFEGRDEPDVSVQLRAGLRLLDLGDVRALECVVPQLSSATSFSAHVLLASLADRLLRSPLEPAQERMLLQRVLTDEFLAAVPWIDVETEHFYAVALALLDPNDGRDRQVVLAFLETLRRLGRGEPATSDIPARTLVDLWRRAARRLPPDEAPSERSFILDIVCSPARTEALAEAMALFDQAVSVGSTDKKHGNLRPYELLDEELTALLRTLRENMSSGNPLLASRSHQWLLRLSDSILPRHGQLRLVAEALVRAGETALGDLEATGQSVAPGTSRLPLIQETERQLAKWSGIGPPAGRDPRRPTFDPSIWVTWLAKPAQVAAREGELVEDAGASAREGAEDLVYYEFILRIRSIQAPSDIASPLFEVLDGHRIEVQARTPTSYVDRWGNPIFLRIDAQESSGGSVPRFRVSGRPNLFLAIPTLTSPPGKELSVALYETADVFLGPRAVSLRGEDAPTYKALLFIGARSEDHVPPGETDPSLLWKSFIDQHVLNLPADAPALRLNSILGIVRSLRLKDCAPLFRRAFAANPSVDLARQLHELGDLTGIDYLKKELNAAEIEKKVLAAAALAELGFPEGVQSLLENIQQNVSASRRFSFQVLKALDVYIQAKDRADPTRKSAMDFVVARMGDPLFQHRCFGIVQRESGQDFGYPVTQPLPDTERRAALEGAVRKAQAWWAEERDRSPPRRGGEER